MGLGIGAFLGGLAGSYGEEQLRRQHEESQRLDRDNQQQLQLFHSMGFNPDVDPEVRKMFLRLAADKFDEQHKGVKGKSKPINLYRNIHDYFSAGQPGATVAQPIPPGAVGPASSELTTQATPPDLFSTAGDYLNPQRVTPAPGESKRMFLNPIEQERERLKMQAGVNRQSDEEAWQQRLTEMRASGATEEQIRQVMMGRAAGFPLAAQREVQPEYEWVQAADGQWKQVVTGQAPPGSIPESAANKPPFRPGSPGQKYQDYVDDAMVNLGMSETEAHTYAGKKRAEDEANAKKLLDSRMSLNQSLLTSRQSTLEGKKGGKAMDVNTARGILQNAQAYKQRLVTAMVANVMNPSAERLAQFDNQAQDMMERELEQAGITLMDLQDIIAGAAGRNPDVGSPDSALDQIFSSK